MSGEENLCMFEWGGIHFCTEPKGHESDHKCPYQTVPECNRPIKLEDFEGKFK